MVFSVLQQKWKKGIYHLLPEQIAIENPGSKRIRYKKVGGVHLLVGPDTYPYAKVLMNFRVYLSIDS